MSKAARFNIFYKGRLYRKNLTAAEITKEFGCKSAMVYQAANTGHKLNKVFGVEKKKARTNGKARTLARILYKNRAPLHKRPVPDRLPAKRRSLSHPRNNCS